MPFIDLPMPPPAPQRTDEPEVFIERADAFVAWQAAFAAAVGTFVSQLEAAAALIAAAPAYADPGLVALTGNSPAADTFPYYTGSNTSELAELSVLARDLMASATPEIWRDLLDAAKSGDNRDIELLRQSVALSNDGSPSPVTIGLRGIPVNPKTAAYEITLADMGQVIAITGGGVTIPNGLPQGFTCSIYNDSGGAQSITCPGETLRLAGTESAGTRTLFARGMATVVKVKPSEWVLGGTAA
ncbi:hypothetical protein [Novosphingobium kaempferiae]|uniref:hypothetical protein n=1 Tax=Novosphingobium kaempferiae TaxID=2896849 RepID=UPI001E38FBDF|nr:hypothetical protein [Novosphingobium kaempferiae]